ncbi:MULTISPECIES: class I SAM-dependent methyltransferase [unclassified Mycobacterium]|uniref:class I SAM-dependent methyltransferase n=1 Tax=unclassified Mycobacterium TaxID=2642494 RepID=UPI00073FBD8C|nr:MULTISPECIES: class I SAM-dependent methyltransferase [unclassified Mycobacterium]KUH81084.1 methyltransferase type 11 [Mycobacterium sp. GA-1999]KUH84095.1 methyltransferase type 11 [Mycobacterium sp. IS-1556]KUH89960.1 methyltransferase type 11 [Mycobacterium sp. GA-0227b]
MGGEQPQRWNHNIHYHQLVLDAVPVEARSALDVGTGNGLLAADLRQKVPEVVAIDVDDDVLEAARGEVEGVDWILGDVMAHRFQRTFDVVASVAALHHLPDLRSALRRFAELTSPGGVLVVVGLARSTRPWDFAVDVLGVVQHRWLSLRRNHWEHTAPTVWPPAHSYSEVRQCAEEELPGVQWRRLPMFRYALTWRKLPIGRDVTPG